MFKVNDKGTTMIFMKIRNTFKIHSLTIHKNIKFLYNKNG